MSARRIKLSVTVIATGLILSACGQAQSQTAPSAQPPQTATSNSTLTPPASPTTTPTATSTPSPPSPLIYVAECASPSNVAYTVSVVSYDLSSTSPAPHTVSTFGAESNQFGTTSIPRMCRTNVNNGPLIASEQFSPDFTKTVAQWTDPKDSSKHVGWIDTAGTTTDVTKAVSTPSDFSAAPAFTNPLFDAIGNFVFYDEAKRQWIWVDSSSLKVIKAVPATGDTGEDRTPPGYIDASGFPLSEQHGEVVPSPDRKFQTTVGPVQAWVSDNSYLALNNGTLWLRGAIPFSALGSANTLPSDKQITPVSDYAVGSAVVSPDGKTTAFIAGRGKEHKLFTMSTAGSDPTKQASLESASDPNLLTSLLAWK